MQLLRFVPCLNRCFADDDRTDTDRADIRSTGKDGLQLNFRKRILSTFAELLSLASFFSSLAFSFFYWRDDVSESVIPTVAVLNFQNISVATLNDSSGQTFVERKKFIERFFCGNDDTRITVI